MEAANACSLAPADRAARERAFAEGVIAEEHDGEAVLLRYRASPERETALRELIELERECCPGVSFELRADGAELVLAIGGGAQPDR